jgi:hypothetical protein
MYGNAWLKRAAEEERSASIVYDLTQFPGSKINVYMKKTKRSLEKRWEENSDLKYHSLSKIALDWHIGDSSEFENSLKILMTKYNLTRSLMPNEISK